MCLTTSISTASATNHPTRQVPCPRPDPPWVTLLILKASTILLHLMHPLQNLNMSTRPHHPPPTNLTPSQCQRPTPPPPLRVGLALPCRSKLPSLSLILRVGGRQSKPTPRHLLASMLLAPPHRTVHITQRSQDRDRAGTHHHQFQPSRPMVTQQHIKQAPVVFSCQAGDRDHQERKDKSRATRLVR